MTADAETQRLIGGIAASVDALRRNQERMWSEVRSEFKDMRAGINEESARREIKRADELTKLYEALHDVRETLMTRIETLQTASANARGAASVWAWIRRAFIAVVAFGTAIAELMRHR